MTGSSSLTFSLSLVLLLVAQPLRAQGVEELLYDPRDNTTGVFLNLAGGFVSSSSAVGASRFAGVDVETTWGSGLGAQLGFGYTPRLLFFAGVDRSWHNSDNAQILGDISLHHFDVGVRAHFHLTDVRYVPYALLALGAKQLYTHEFVDTAGVARRTTINARTISSGVGMQFFISENFALDGSAMWSFGDFNKIDIDQTGESKLTSSGGTTMRVRFGVSWYPDH